MGFDLYKWAPSMRERKSRTSASNMVGSITLQCSEHAYTEDQEQIKTHWKISLERSIILGTFISFTITMVFWSFLLQHPRCMLFFFFAWQMLHVKSSQDFTNLHSCWRAFYILPTITNPELKYIL